jgi:6-phospho-beta-glucosidase
MVKLTVLGGSSVASPELVRILAATGAGRPLEVMLHGRTARKLDLVGRVCARVAGGHDGLGVRWTTSLEEALDGADVILVQVRVGGYLARAFDETFPHEFGLPGEETMGPGGFANSLRTVPVVVTIGRAIEARAPHAWVLNLTNPSSVVQLALHRTTRLRVLGLCDSPVSMREGIVGMLGADSNAVRLEYVGMHHFGWITRAWRSGRDVTDEVLARAAELPWIAAPVDLIRSIGAIPHPYLNYVLAPQTMLSRQQGKRARALELVDLEAHLLSEYETAVARDDMRLPEGVTLRRAVWYAKIIAPVMQHLLTDTQAVQIVNVANRGIIPWLPPDAVVEGPAVIDPVGARLLASGDAPRDVVALTQHNCAYESLLVDAILEQSFEKAWRAMTLNLLVRDATQARRLLERIWPAGGAAMETVA